MRKILVLVGVIACAAMTAANARAAFSSAAEEPGGRSFARSQFAPRQTRSIQTRPDPDSALLARALAAELAFFDRWQARLLPKSFSRDTRAMDAGCRNGYFDAEALLGPRLDLRRIRSRASALAVCPNWLLDDTGASAAEEGVAIDNALVASARSDIREERAVVLALLDSAANVLPENAFITGQRVRFLLDQNEHSRALQVAQQCRARPSFCDNIEGYVLYRRGEWRAAEAAFDRAIERLDEATACAWMDVAALLAPDDRKAYSQLDCGTRVRFIRQIWWLADPLWSDSVNERRVEQFARQVATDLHAATGRDERYEWDASGGGDALREMMLRYGWPTRSQPVNVPAFAMVGGGGMSGSGVVNLYPGRSAFTGWGRMPPLAGDPLQRAFNSMRLDLMTTGWNDVTGTPVIERSFDIGSLFAAVPVALPPSYGVTFEYATNRVHTVPTWRALADPLHATAADWELVGPRDDQTPPRWWPQEHFAPPQAMTQFHDQQTALLRREARPLLAFATNLARADLRRNADASAEAVAIASPVPDHFEAIGAATTRAGETLRMVMPVAAHPNLVSVEIPSQGGSTSAARTRFAIAPPPPLALLTPTERAVSDPVLLYAPADGALSNDPDGALAAMMGTTTLAPGTPRVGLYWESYGFGVGDSLTITIAVRVLSTHEIERLAPATTRRSRPSAGSTVTLLSWSEPQSARSAYLIGPRALSRSVVLDVAQLPPGDYALTVTTVRGKDTAVSSVRTFTVQ